MLADMAISVDQMPDTKQLVGDLLQTTLPQFEKDLQRLQRICRTHPLRRLHRRSIPIRGPLKPLSRVKRNIQRSGPLYLLFMRSLTIEAGLRRRCFSPSVIIQRQANPIIEITLIFHRICIYMHVSSVRSPFHYHSPAAFTFQHGVVKGRVDAAHNSVSTDADTHLPSNHESDAAKHPLFLNVNGAAKSNSHTL